MLKNYFKTALRNLLKNKTFSLINIVGLSLGLACCMLIILYTKDEVSFDSFHANKSRLYQLTCDRFEKEGTHEKFAIAAMVQGPAFKQAIPGIDAYVRVNNKQLVIKKGGETFNESFTWADDNFFSVFSFPLLYGQADNVLSNLHSAVLTDEMAEKYFGNASPTIIGKTLLVEINGNFEPFIITGIAKKAPQNSSIKFNIILPFKYLQQVNPDNGWMWVSYPTYFLLNKNANVGTVKGNMQAVYKTQAKAEIDLNHEAGYDNTFIWGLKPFTQMHLNTDYEGTPEASNPIYSYVLSGVAVFILLIACINFINLTVTQSLKRSKEIGIRKVVGGLRKQLTKQFLGESMAVCFISFLLAFALAYAALPMFNELANKRLSLPYLFDAKLAVGFALLFIVTGLAAGFYPALVLSGFNPVETLYNRVKFSGKNRLAQSLVVIQFSLAAFLIIATLFIYAQFSLLTKTSLGYDDKNLVEFTVDKAVMNKPLMDVCKTLLLKLPGVEDASYSNIGKFGGKTIANNKELTAVYERVDYNYLQTLQTAIIEGRNFSKDFPSDSTDAVLVNETFANEAGWQNAVGKTVDYMNLPGWGNRKITVVGVARDYHYESLKEKIKPQIFTMETALPLGKFLVRIKPTNIPLTVAAIEKVFHTIEPDHPFEYYFKDDLNNKSYEAESKWKQIITLGAILTIFISCTGLFGLAMLSAQKRAKEISIRKTLGASAGRIVQLVSADFLKLVFISFFIAVPIAGYAVNSWLQNFAYRVALSWWMFALAGALSLIIALAAVSFHTIKAALSNPVNALRSE